GARAVDAAHPVAHAFLAVGRHGDSLVGCCGPANASSRECSTQDRSFREASRRRAAGSREGRAAGGLIMSTPHRSHVLLISVIVVALGFAAPLLGSAPRFNAIAYLIATSL